MKTFIFSTTYTTLPHGFYLTDEKSNCPPNTPTIMVLPNIASSLHPNGCQIQPIKINGGPRSNSIGAQQEISILLLVSKIHRSPHWFLNPKIIHVRFRPIQKLDFCLQTRKLQKK